MPSPKYKIHEKFMEGYQEGLTWPDIWESHKPGGPYTRGSQQGVDEKKAGLEGWEDGHQEKLRTKRSNPPRS